MQDFVARYKLARRNHPEVIQVEVKTYLTSNNCDSTPIANMGNLLSYIKHSIPYLLNDDIFNKEYIFDYDIYENDASQLENKILSFQLFIKQKEIHPIEKNEHVYKLIHNLCEKITTCMQTNEIQLSKNKRRRKTKLR